MPRGIESNALGASGANQATAAGSVGTLSPLYTRMATSPQGYTPQQMANFTTSSMQAAGGSAAGAVGMGGLAAARTNNAGGYQAAVADAARTAGVTNSQNNLQVQNQDAQLMQKQQAEGLSGLESIYGTSTNAGLNYLNTGLTASNDTNNAVLGGLGIAASVLGANKGFQNFGSGCWIAEAIYGSDDVRTHTVRGYLNGEFRASRLGGAIMRLYLRFGERVAKIVRRSWLLRALLRPFFDRAFSDAIAVSGPPVPSFEAVWISPTRRPSHGCVSPVSRL